MKKVLIIMGMALTGPALFAQNGSASMSASGNGSSGGTITDKKGEVYLPQAGDWAIGMDATPWLQYFGNFFHGSGTTAAPTAAFLNQNQTLIGKYFVDDHTAYRALVRIGFNSYSQNAEISSSDTAAASAFPLAQVEDKRSISSHFIGLGAGMEKRRGSTRLQGYYGAEAMIFIAGSDTTFTYGNAYNVNSNPNPAWYDWNSQTTVAGLPRLTENKAGSTFGIGVLGYIGFEYFFAPKISIGGEYTWGIAFQSTGQGSVSVEEINSITGKDQTDTYKTGGGSAFTIDTGLNQAFGSGTGSLYINFHF